MKSVTRTMLTHSQQVAKSAKARSIIVCADALTDPEDLEQLEGGKDGIDILRAGGPEGDEKDADGLIRLPDLGLTRMGQVKLAVLVALSRGLLENEDVIVCLSGLSGSGVLDTLVVLDVGNEFEIFHSNPDPITEAVDEAVFERVLQVAGLLAREGREGRPVGTTFVLGDSDDVAQHVQQMILNPLEGHPRKRRNIMDPALEETVRELSALDGAFILDREGILLSAGTYLDAPTQGITLRQGLGARHYSAASMTKATKAVAVTLSESSGNLTVFKGGGVLIEIEKPPERRKARTAAVASSPPGKSAKLAKASKSTKAPNVSKKSKGS